MPEPIRDTRTPAPGYDPDPQGGADRARGPSQGEGSSGGPTVVPTRPGGASSGSSARPTEPSGPPTTVETTTPDALVDHRGLPTTLEGWVAWMNADPARASQAYMEHCGDLPASLRNDPNFQNAMSFKLQEFSRTVACVASVQSMMHETLMSIIRKMA